MVRHTQPYIFSSVIIWITYQTIKKNVKKTGNLPAIHMSYINLQKTENLDSFKDKTEKLSYVHKNNQGSVNLQIYNS